MHSSPSFYFPTTADDNFRYVPKAANKKLTGASEADYKDYSHLKSVKNPQNRALWVVSEIFFFLSFKPKILFHFLV